MNSTNTFHIGIYIYDQVLISTALGLYDIIMAANGLTAKFDLHSNNNTTFKVTLLSWDGSPIAASNGLTITPQRGLKHCKGLDALVIPGMMNSECATIEPFLLKKIKSLHRADVLLCSICAGSFYLAHAGILNGKRATSHWDLINDYKEQFPLVNWTPNNLLVLEDTIITSGGVSSFQELGLYLIQKYHSKLLAKYVSNFMLIEPNRNIQNPYQMTLLPQSHSDHDILKVQKWIEKNFHNHIDQKSMTQVVRMGERTFMRHFKKSTGYTPLQYLQEVRLTKAKALLEESTHTFEEITFKVGYEDVSSFRKLFLKRIGLTPGSYRTRFCFSIQ
ncbi:MAG: helix-turn-helix domain-containing protein [Fibrobacterales bacterium]